MIEIHKMLALSTAHVKMDTAKRFDNDCAEVVHYKKSGYGWFVVVPDTEDFSPPSDLNDCFRFARQHECNWIMFDRDVSPIASLPTYEW